MFQKHMGCNRALSKSICWYPKGRTTICRSRKVTRPPERNTRIEVRHQLTWFYRVFQEHIGVLPAPLRTKRYHHSQLVQSQTSFWVSVHVKCLYSNLWWRWTKTDRESLLLPRDYHRQWKLNRQRTLDQVQLCRCFPHFNRNFRLDLRTSSKVRKTDMTILLAPQWKGLIERPERERERERIGLPLFSCCLSNFDKEAAWRDLASSGTCPSHRKNMQTHPKNQTLEPFVTIC